MSGEAASTQKGYYLTNYLGNYLTYYRVSKWHLNLFHK